jgi:thiamine biosynthesis lipoprotein
MEQRGFDRHYATGERADTRAASDATWRDVRCDAAAQTITIARPLVLDLGAVAKGFAIDLAVRELTPFVNFAIDAGGDVYLAGRRSGGEPWTVGIRHPREDGALLGTLRVSDRAVCTSGDYERRTATGEGHIFDPHTQGAASSIASVTAVASSAMVADAAGTAAFVLGPSAGVALFDRLGIEGVIIDRELRSLTTAGMADALLPHA